MDPILTITSFALGAYAGWKLSAWVWQKILVDVLAKFGVSEDDAIRALEQLNSEATEENSDEFEITVEKVNEQLMAYARKDGRFLAQSETATELVTKVYEIANGRKITIERDRGADLIEDVLVKQ